MDEQGSNAAQAAESLQNGPADAMFWQSCFQSNDPTNYQWSALRQKLIEKLAVEGEPIELPLFSLEALQRVPSLNLPRTCSSFPNGAEGSQQWPLALVDRPATLQEAKLPASNEKFKAVFALGSNTFLKHINFAKNKCCVAGGFVEACLHGEPWNKDRNNGDIDIFFYNDNSSFEALAEAAFGVCESIFKAVLEDPSIPYIIIKRNKLTLNLEIPEYRTIQLILPVKVPSSVSEIVHRFDLDSCQLAFDGSGVLCTWKALRAWAFKANFLDMEYFLARGYRSTAYLTEHSHRKDTVTATATQSLERSLKYARRGYTVAVPGICQETVDGIKADIVAKYVDYNSPQYLLRNFDPSAKDNNALADCVYKDCQGLGLYFFLQNVPNAAMLRSLVPGFSPRKPILLEEYKLTREFFHSFWDSPDNYHGKSGKDVLKHILNLGAPEKAFEKKHFVRYEVLKEAEKLRGVQEAWVQGKSMSQFYNSAHDFEMEEAGANGGGGNGAQGMIID